MWLSSLSLDSLSLVQYAFACELSDCHQQCFDSLFVSFTVIKVEVVN
jgi:hypothetical protein